MPRILRHAPILAAALALLCATPTCNMTQFVVRRTGPALLKAHHVIMGYRDPEMARQALPGILALLEGLLASDPKNPQMLELLARGLYEFTFGFLQLEYDRLHDTDPRAANRLRLRIRTQFLKVYELGLRLLRLRGVQITLQRTPLAEIKRRIARLDKRGVPGLTWTAVGAGGALLMGLDQPWLMQMRPKIPVLLERAATLHPGYANAVPLGALGMYYGQNPLAGGSPLRSQQNFQRAIQLTKRRFLLWLVAYARNWAWQFQSLESERVGFGAKARRVPITPRNKRALFVKLLDEVRRFPLASAPEYRLANTMAKREAARLYPKKDDFLSWLPARSLGGHP